MEWKPIEGYDGYYEVSSNGDIKRIKSGYGAVVGRILKPYLNKVTGYYYVTLTKNCIPRDFTVHKLVVRAFLGNSSLQINHKNGIKTDNRINNLEYMTPSQNLIHATRTLLKRSGEDHWNSRLTQSDVQKIRSLRDSGLTHEQISKAFNVSRPTITEILIGRKWKTVP